MAEQNNIPSSGNTGTELLGGGSEKKYIMVPLYRWAYTVHLQNADGTWRKHITLDYIRRWQQALTGPPVYAYDWEFQLERTEKQLLHLQGWLLLYRPMTLLQLKNALGDDAVHLEAIRSQVASEHYCRKSQTQVGGPWNPTNPYKVDPHAITLRHWQVDLLQILDREPDGRRLLWLWDSKGGVGKTTMMDWLAENRSAAFFNGYESKKETDDKLLTFNYPDIIVIDIPYDYQWHLYPGIWAWMESFKRRVFISGKYKGKKKVKAHPPHVVIFANFAPDEVGAKFTDNRILEFQIVDSGTPLKPINSDIAVVVEEVVEIID